MNKFKVNDIIKITNSVYKDYKQDEDYNRVNNRLAIIIKIDLTTHTKYIYKVRFIDNLEEILDKIDYYYKDEEITKISKEEAMLELL